MLRKKRRLPFGRSAVITAGGSFPDGSFVDLVRDDGATDSLRFVVWDGKTASLKPNFHISGVQHEVPEVDPGLVSAVRIPTTLTAQDETRTLFGAVSDLITRATGWPRNIVALCTFQLFALWLAEFLPCAPLLWLVMPPISDGGSVLRLFRLLCRHAAVVNELTLQALSALPNDLRPTILTEVTKITEPFIKAVRASSRPGTFVPIRGQLLDLSCGRVVVTSQAFPRREILDAPLEIVVPPVQDLALDWNEIESTAAQLRTRLMLYRLRNYNRVKVPDLPVEGLPCALRGMARSLAAAIIGGDGLQADIVALLEPYAKDLEAQSAVQLEAIVWEALLAACHRTVASADRTDKKISVEDITASTNTILIGRGEALEVSPERVGWKLRAAGLHTEYLTGGSRGLALTAEVRRKIHERAAAFGVATLVETGPIDGCPECAALNSKGGLPGRIADEPPQAELKS